MADIFDWSPTASSNTTVDGININTGMPVGNTDNALRSVMAIIRQSFSSPLKNFLAGVSALPVSSGGTGAATAADARINLGIGAVALENVLTVAKGGTGAADANTALSNLNALRYAGGSPNTSPGYVNLVLGNTGLTFIVQWGTAAAQGDNYTSVTYPTPFALFSIPVVSGTSRVTNGAEQGSVTTSATTTGFQFYTAEGGSGNIGTAWWIAVGV